MSECPISRKKRHVSREWPLSPTVVNLQVSTARTVPWRRSSVTLERTTRSRRSLSVSGVSRASTARRNA